MSAGEGPKKPDDDAIGGALSRVLRSASFAGSGRARELLTYVVAEALAGRGARIAPRTIARDVFGRDEAFDASADPLVRVEMGRTRDLLERYYVEEGARDPVLIAIPRGGCAPDFAARPPAAGGAAATDPAPPPTGEPRARGRRSWAGSLVAGGIAAGLGLVGLGAVLRSEPIAQDAGGPVVAVLPFEDLTDRRAGGAGGRDEDAVGAGFQRAVARDLQRLRTVRVAVTEDEAPPSARFVVSGSVLSVDDGVDFVLRLRRAGGDRPLLSARLRSGEEVQYREALRTLSARAAGHAADPASAQADAMIDLPGAAGGAAFRCFLAFERFEARPTPEGLAESHACLVEATRQRPGDGTLLGALAWTVALGAPGAGGVDASPLAAELSLDRALATAERAVAVDPSNDDAHARLGLIQWRAGHERAAVESLRRAVALNPGDPQHAARLAHLLAFSGAWDEAERMVRRATTRSGNPPGWYVMPLYYRALVRGRGRAALAHLTASEASADPDGPVYALAAAAAAGDQARILALRPTVEALATARGGDPLRGARAWIRSDEILSVLEARLEEAGVSVLRG